MTGIEDELARHAAVDTHFQPRITLLAGGDTVYLYNVGDPNIPAMHGVLDVMYPGSEVLLRTLPVKLWDDEVRAKIVALGVDIVDVRGGGGDTP